MDACGNAATQVKRFLTEGPVLDIYNLSRPCVVYVDASQNGLGAVLKQVGYDKEKHPIA